MSAEEGSTPVPEASAVSRGVRLPAFGRVAQVALIIGCVLLALLILLWLERKPIVEGFVDRELRRRGVAARYAVADIGWNRQRLTNLSIGDPAHPDLIADWVELDTSIGLGGAALQGVRAGKVRLHGRLVDGRLALGALDRLLPSRSGRPFALPDINLDIADGRMWLVTPAGLLDLTLRGSGRLVDGFAGRLTAVSRTLEIGNCTTGAMAASLAVRIIDTQPALTGPISARSIACGKTTARSGRLTLDARLGSALDRWKGSAKVALAGIADPVARLGSMNGTIGFEGSAARTSGSVDLTGGDLLAPRVRAAAVGLSGSYDAGTAGSSFDGSVRLSRASVPVARRRLAGIASAAPATPIAPLLARAAAAAARASDEFDVDAGLSVRIGGRDQAIVARAITATSASGATLSLTGGQGLSYRLDDGRLGIDGLLALAGGDLPEATFRLRQAEPGGAVNGSGIVSAYAAGAAKLALGAVSFTATRSGATRLIARATLSGPIGDGQLTNATLPIDAQWDGRSRITVNPGCAPLRFDRVSIAGLVLNPSRLTLCPTGGALLQIDGSRVRGGARVAAPRLAGTAGGTPLRLAADEAVLRLTDNGLAVRGVIATLGPDDRQSRLTIGRLAGTIGTGAIGGTFGDTAGQIAKVPLAMSKASGTWTLADGALRLGGDLMLADADAAPRFKPLASHDVRLALVDNEITATGTLVQPDTGITVTDVAIRHDLSSGSGRAELAVPGIVFNKQFQPDRLTRLTFGVIADVHAAVSGEGHIAWTRDGVTSNGVFRTKDADLAAAFGPVTGLSTEIHFTDLLNLQSAPHQVATIATINPGVPVENGVVRYATLPDRRVMIEGATWPFAAGALDLEPTLLDFSENQERRMTFTVTGMHAAEFLQQFDFKNLNATGIFDGKLPMIFNAQGGRIEGGHLTVRPGGGTLAYVGEVSQKDLGFWGNVAFQALKSLRYQSLEIVMNGPLAGEMITEVRFAGISQGEGARRNFLIDRIAKLPFVFNVRIQAPFRGLIDSAASFYDPRRLIERNLPALIRAQQQAEGKVQPLPSPATPIQPPESEHQP